jgi:NADH dehydrogenase
VVNNKVIVFGGSGFVGKHITKKLVEAGYVVTIPTRNPDNISHLKLLGDNVKPVTVDINNYYQVNQLVSQQNMVVNCIGILYPTQNNSFSQIHSKFPLILSGIIKQYDHIKSYVHLSAIGADYKSSSQYAQSKGYGEVAVMANIKYATILRPSIIFGREDNFINLFANMAKFSPFLPAIGGGKTKFQPIFVEDVATSVLHCLTNNKTKGKIYELGGDNIFNFKDILKLAMKVAGVWRPILPIPFIIAHFQGLVIEKLMTHPLLTRDQVLLLKSDNVVNNDNKSVLTIKDLEIQPMELNEKVYANYPTNS